MQEKCGSNSGVESQPSKLLVAGSNPVSRSTKRKTVNGRRKTKVGVCEVELTVIPSPAILAVRLPFAVCRLTAERAHVAQSVEHVLGKDEVTSSNLVVGSRNASR
jgi:hypothetical protein